MDFPYVSISKESVFDPCVGRIPWRRERLSTPVIWPGVHGVTKSQTQLRDFHLFSLSGQEYLSSLISVFISSLQIQE